MSTSNIWYARRPDLVPPYADFKVLKKSDTWLSVRATYAGSEADATKAELALRNRSRAIACSFTRNEGGTFSVVAAGSRQAAAALIHSINRVLLGLAAAPPPPPPPPKKSLYDEYWDKRDREYWAKRDREINRMFEDNLTACEREERRQAKLDVERYYGTVAERGRYSGKVAEDKPRVPRVAVVVEVPPTQPTA